jgi:hypothetical protein
MREIAPGVFVGPRAVLGPDTVIEDGSYIDNGAEITGSVVGPRTYVGAFTELRESFAWGDVLLHPGTGSLTAVPDRFLLGELRSSTGFGGGLRDALRSLRGRQTAKDPGTGSLRTAARRARLEPQPVN